MVTSTDPVPAHLCLDLWKLTSSPPPNYKDPLQFLGGLFPFKFHGWLDPGTQPRDRAPSPLSASLRVGFTVSQALSLWCP